MQGLFESLGEAAAWRRSEHEREIRERATAAFLAAQQEECRTLPLLHAAQDAAFEEEERQLEEAKRWREEEFERRTQQCREELKREQVRCLLPAATRLSCAPMHVDRAFSSWLA